MENKNANRKLGGRKKVSTYDFSTLFTSIPHEKLKFNMKEFVSEVFKHAGKKIINSSKNSAYLSKNRSDRADASFSQVELIKAIEMIIDNNHIQE